MFLKTNSLVFSLGSLATPVSFSPFGADFQGSDGAWMLVHVQPIQLGWLKRSVLRQMRSLTFIFFFDHTPFVCLSFFCNPSTRKEGAGLFLPSHVVVCDSGW